MRLPAPIAADAPSQVLPRSPGLLRRHGGSHRERSITYGPGHHGQLPFIAWSRLTMASVGPAHTRPGDDPGGRVRGARRLGGVPGPDRDRDTDRRRARDHGLLEHRPLRA